MKKYSVISNNYSLLSRREFIWITSLSTAGVVTGCATNPVSGKKQFMLMSEKQEIGLDKENSPHQFSADYGPVKDHTMNSYMNKVGKELAAVSHRPKMPYSFRVVNATYVNAYAFPGGSIATTRGIMLGLENEAELAALLGHEIGHVSARHTAERVSKGMLLQISLLGAAVYLDQQHKKYAPLAVGLGGIGAGMLLAKYSRDDERQADSLGLEYMTRANQNPEGMVGLMDLLNSLSNHKPSAIEQMFASHPMSDERYKTATNSVNSQYASMKDRKIGKERYMDNIAELRKIKGAVEEMQKGEKEMAQKKFPAAETHFARALQIAPNDYAGLLMMSKCMLAMNNQEQARHYAELAKQAYPKEPQARHVAGMAKLNEGRYGGALNDFTNYEKLLPGNPNTTFYRAFCFEKMGRKKEAANEYNNFLQIVDQGDEAQYAHNRLVNWGYIKKSE